MTQMTIRTRAMRVVCPLYWLFTAALLRNFCNPRGGLTLAKPVQTGVFVSKRGSFEWKKAILKSSKVVGSHDLRCLQGRPEWCAIDKRYCRFVAENRLECQSCPLVSRVEP